MRNFWKGFRNYKESRKFRKVMHQHKKKMNQLEEEKKKLYNCMMKILKV